MSDNQSTADELQDLKAENDLLRGVIQRLRDDALRDEWNSVHAVGAILDSVGGSILLTRKALELDYRVTRTDDFESGGFKLTSKRV